MWLDSNVTQQNPCHRQQVEFLSSTIRIIRLLIHVFRFHEVPQGEFLGHRMWATSIISQIFHLVFQMAVGLRPCGNWVLDGRDGSSAFGQRDTLPASDTQWEVLLLTYSPPWWVEWPKCFPCLRGMLIFCWELSTPLPAWLLTSFPYHRDLQIFLLVLFLSCFSSWDEGFLAFLSHSKGLFLSVDISNFWSIPIPNCKEVS